MSVVKIKQLHYRAKQGLILAKNCFFTNMRLVMRGKTIMDGTH